MSTSKPHIVILHGAWHSPTYCAKITALLQHHLYVVHAQQLPSVGSQSPPTDDAQDVAAARALVDDAIANGNDVVVICHSWGGTVAGSALVGYSKKERAEKGLKGGVVKVGYMCAFMIDEGISLQGAIGGDHPPWTEVDGPFITAKDPSVFYNTLPESEQAYWFSQLQTHSLATFDTPTTGASWKTIPSSFLLCEQDRAIPAPFQEAMVNAAKEKGAQVDLVRMDSDHSPFLSKPKETVDWIRSVAGEQ
ncbi:Alpha/beta hydrolase fold-1 [Boeremia exigua]|uniref:Alpha/beta hydrolase fold-1 n=1 Tax=Boeremia exigua TaxID=749465 RepID=UPI001E8E08B9|nr:Alpha/beta hydrolase fold-1 [Boeremia exigua]KAH6642501.1 Alpha/beta hydrolase fold-1 [Boeremia exigua]